MCCILSDGEEEWVECADGWQHRRWWVRRSIVPLRGAGGVVTHFVGMQTFSPAAEEARAAQCGGSPRAVQRQGGLPGNCSPMPPRLAPMAPRGVRVHAPAAMPDEELPIGCGRKQSFPPRCHRCVVPGITRM